MLMRNCLKFNQLYFQKVKYHKCALKTSCTPHKYQEINKKVKCTGRLKKNAIVSNDDIWVSLYLDLRASDLQNSCVYPP